MTTEPKPMPDLLPCPFCGHAPEWNNSQKSFSLQCSGSPDGPFYGDYSCQHRCHVSPNSGDWKNEKSAIEAWNTRAEPVNRQMYEALKLAEKYIGDMKPVDNSPYDYIRQAITAAEQQLEKENG